MEDSSDTTSVKVSFVLVEDDKEEDYDSECAEEYGYQDYSYRFNSELITRNLSIDDIAQLDSIIHLFMDEHLKAIGEVKKMNPDPLKGQKIGGGSDLIGYFSQKDVKSAVEWLKNGIDIATQNGCISMNYQKLNRLIDKAFADVVDKEDGKQ